MQMPRHTFTLVCLLAAASLTAASLHAQAQGSATAPLKSSITLDSGVTFPALPGQNAAGGKLSFTAPFIEGQALTSMRNVVHMKFPRSRDEKRNTHAIRLVNGDRLVGDLVTLDEDVAIFDTDMLGELEIPRDIIHTITRRGKTPLLIESSATVDGFDAWTIEKRTHFGLATGGHARKLLCRIPHDGPVTLIATVDTTADREVKGFQIDFTLFTPDPANHYKFGSLAVTVGSRISTASLRTAAGSRKSVRGDPWIGGRGKLRITYDPATFTVELWADEKRLIGNTLDAGPEAGKYVAISLSSIKHLQSVRMYRGIDLADGDTAPADDTESIILTNGDRLNPNELAIADERIVARTPDGNTYKPDLDKIAHIVMRKKGRRTLPRPEGDIRVYL
ncbi:MAG: hypothetical protein GY700_10825, partial [Propionibacteriaceae bacterium]|nr:hypothetical protein [Propionibacteriaceae bacterium]